MTKFVRLAKENIRDFLEFILVPGLAAVLPWPLCFRLFRLLTKWPGLYNQAVEAMLTGAQDMGYVCNKQQWARDYRLQMLVDQADLYLSRFRSDKWLDQHFQARGDVWPVSADRSTMGITFHWGTGLLVFRYLRRQGIEAAGIFQGSNHESFTHRPIRQWYGRWRIREVERSGGCAAIFTGRKTITQLRETLAQNRAVIALLDIPPDGSMPGIPVQIFDQKAQFPRGLIRIATRKQLPVVGFTVALDRNTGMRILRTKGPLPNANEQELMDSLAQLFREAISRDPVAWYFWPFARSFFTHPKHNLESPSV